MALYPASWIAQCDRCGTQLKGADLLDAQNVLAAVVQIGWELALSEAGTAEMHCGTCVGNARKQASEFVERMLDEYDPPEDVPLVVTEAPPPEPVDTPEPPPTLTTPDPE